MANTEKIVVQVQVKGGKDLNRLSKDTKKATKSAGGLTKGMVAMAGGVMAAVAAFRQIGRVISGAIKTFTAFEFQMAKVKAISGASDKDFAKLSQTAQDLGRTTFFTAQQVAELQTNYAKLGFTTSEILNAQEATLLLATATGSDLARAATVAGAAVRGFGLDASETTRVVDVMTLAFNSSALDIEKWQTSMTKVAPIAAGMNIEIEDTAAIMGTLTDAGIEASIAGTSMRNIFLKMKDSSSDLSKFLGFTVNSSVDLSKALEKLGTASDKTLDGLVNIRQVAAFSVMVKGAKRVEKLREELRLAEGAAEEAASIIGDTLEGAFKRLTSATQGLAIKLTGDLGGGLQDAVDRFANWINKITDSSDAIANGIRVTAKIVKWLIKLRIAVFAATTSFRLFKAASLGATTMNGTFLRSLVLVRGGLRALVVSLGAAKIAIKSLIASTGIGIIVVALTTLAERFMFAGDAAEDAAEDNDDYAMSLRKLAKEQKAFEDFENRKLATTIKQGKADEKTHKQRLVNFEATRDYYKNERDLLKVNSDAWDAKNKLFTDYAEKVVKVGDKLLRIQLNNAQMRAHNEQTEYDKALKAEKDRNAKLVLEEKKKYLNNEITKKVLNEKLDKLEIKHLENMKVIHSNYNEDVGEIDADILELKIKAHESEADSFKKQQDKIHKQRDKNLVDEHKRNIVFINDKTKTEEQQEKNAKTHADKIIEIQTNAFNDEIELADEWEVDKTQIEQDFVDFQLKNIEDVAEAKKLANEKDLEDQKEISKQKLEVMKAASDAIFTIMADNLSQQTQRETKKLEERKDAGLITEEQYEKGVEKIQRKAFERKKRMDIAQAIINGALAMTTTMGQTGLLAFAFSPFIAAMTALQVAVIAAQQFAQGGMIEEFANGGMVQGKSHAQGGEKFAVGGRVVELEGGEAVINKRSTSMFRNQLSAMNSAGGGVKFADGGLLNMPSFSQQQFNALGQNQMMGAMGNSSKVVVVEADITDSQNTVSVIQSEATI